MLGSEALIQALLAEGVRCVAGNPGSTEVQWLDMLPKYPDLRYFLALHEDIAVGMAEGYALASGRLAVASLHTTPGMAHGLGNLFNAARAGSPLVVLVGQQDSRLLIRDPFLASDIGPLVREHVKWHWQVGRAEEIPLAVHRACKIATDPPPGPVAIIIPRDLYDEVFELDGAAPTRATIARGAAPDPAMVDRAADLLLRASHPAILCGPGAAPSGGVQRVAELADVVGAPVFDDIRYPPTFPTADPRYHGLLSPEAAGTLDLLVVLGQKVFIERVYEEVGRFPQDLPIIHVDASPWELGKNLPVAVGILSDPGLAAEAFISAIRVRATEPWLETVRRRRAALEQARVNQREAWERDAQETWSREPLSGQRLALELRRAAPEDAALVVEATSHHAQLRRHFTIREPGLFHKDVGGCLGWALPAALGVKMARPERTVLCVVGDGSFLYYPQALWTAQRYGLALVVVVCNNHGYLNDKLWIRRRAGPSAARGDYSAFDITAPDVDFVRYAEAVGARGARVKHPDELGPALGEAIGSGGTWVLDVLVDPWDSGGTV